MAKQRNQTNSNLLGMDQGAAMRPVPGLALESRGICSGQASGPNIFFRVGPPGKLQAASPQAGGPAHKESGFKQLRLTADKLIGYYKIHK